MLSLPLLVILLLAVILGSVYYLFLRGAPRDSRGWRAVAWTGCWAGIAAIVLTILAGVLSFTEVLDEVAYRQMLAVISFLSIPAALTGVACGALGLKSSTRRPALIGLMLSLLCIATWFIMEAGH